MSNNFQSILKSTGLIGAVQIIKLSFGLLRNKLIAYFLGPTGMGVWSLYQAFTEMFQNLSNLGLDKSAVKFISENSEEERYRNLIIQITRYSIFVSAAFVSILIALFSKYFSNSLFNTQDYSTGIIVCAFIVFINSLSNAYLCILNGLNEIKKIAFSQLIGVVCGSSIVLALVPFFGVEAIPFYLLIIALFAFIPTFVSVRGLRISELPIDVEKSIPVLVKLIKVGFAFWLSAVFQAFMVYLTNIYLKENLSIEALGIYQACWTISNLYIGIILSSMGVAFFPKICKVIENREESSQLINEQIEFGLLVSLPVVLTIFLFSPFLLTILYSGEFKFGEDIIRWQILGVVIRLLGFPFGYALMAKGLTKQYTLSQFTFSTLNFLFIILLVSYFGFEGLGINYFFAYSIYGLLTGIACYKLLGFKPNATIYKMILIYLVLISLSVAVLMFCEGYAYYLISVGLILYSFIFSIKSLKERSGFDVIDFIKKKLFPLSSL